MTAPSTTTPARRRGFRLTPRVFWDLAVYMIGLGLAVGLVFPPFATGLGVPSSYATRPSFLAACLVAGFLVGAMSYTVCRAVVGGRLSVLSTHLRSVAETVTRASHTGDFSWRHSDRIPVDSDDELGETAGSFNSLLDALEAGERFRSLVRNASDVITVVDASGRIVYQTPSIGWVLGYPPATLLGSNVRSLLHPDDVPAFSEHLVQALSGSPELASVGSRMRHRNGSWRWVETVANNLLTDPAVNGIVLTTRDVSDRKELEDRLRAQAYHDPLTGLPNRALFMERLRAAEEQEKADGTPSAVLFLDMDNLKTVNDDLGHESGDTLLQVVAARLRTCLRPEDTVARLAGDEFAVLITGEDDVAEAGRVADRVLASMREPVLLDNRFVRTGVSMGVATSETAAASGISLLRAADVAMYVAKSTGKGRRETFQPAHHAAQVERDRLTADLHQALDRHQFELHYQPIVDLAAGQVTGFEALVRWHHPERGLIPPMQFIGLAEESGQIVPIGRWILHEACRQAAAWHRRAPERGLRMSVNVSVRQFQHPDLVEDVVDALRASGLEPGLLTLEITESLFADDTADTLRKLEEIKALGVRLALDDFGTGYSSLGYLRRFPVDVLKIDKAFVDGVATNPEDRAVTHAVIQLGRMLQLQVVAEGLECPEQAAALAELDCPLGQGFHFAPPMAAAEATEFAAAASGLPVGAGIPSPAAVPAAHG
ncbi:EAL domain-containing protein [Geodermatophilus sp. YIM 151500]|uniref:putative bifunctional diguanylate cyclase/phosphodiesterase n=1 Tax=Geodermatophilus sp. YIM 151500 TaxID=2984531 RepID=UPI0021E43019|nr:EAL domain-containing protein [Geodermatophilus sp. YIM 151500]MCV2490069.1 EAL domain-containing protein [Geodermatophilus sp. YIM 151500]